MRPPHPSQRIRAQRMKAESNLVSQFDCRFTGNRKRSMERIFREATYQVQKVWTIYLHRLRETRDTSTTRCLCLDLNQLHKDPGDR